MLRGLGQAQIGAQDDVTQRQPQNTHSFQRREGNINGLNGALQPREVNAADFSVLAGVSVAVKYCMTIYGKQNLLE